jgi:hypothetical protein
MVPSGAGMVYPEDLSEDFGNLAALETVSLVGCEVAALPATITSLAR